MDNDPQFNATSFFYAPEDYIQNVLNNDELRTIVDIYERPPRLGSRSAPKPIGPNDVIRNRYFISTSGVVFDIIPSRLELFETLDSPGQKENKLNRFLQRVHDKYHYVFIDCPPTTTVLTRAAFAASQHVVIPVTPDHFATIGLPQFLATLSDFKENLTDDYNVSVLGVVFTKVPSNMSEPVKQAFTNVRLATKKGDLPLLVADLPDLSVFKRAIWQARPVQQLEGRGLSGKGKANQAIRAISTELLGLIRKRHEKESAK